MKIVSTNHKMQKYQQKYPREFIIRGNSLYCKLCFKVVCVERKSSLDSHRNSLKHQKLLSGTSGTNPNFLVPQDKQLADLLIKALVSQDIPLKKLRSKEFKELFEFLNVKLPSESALRSHLLSKYAPQTQDRVFENLADKKIFLMIDETVKSTKRYINIIGGDVAHPHKYYLLESKVLEKHATHQTILREIVSIIEKIQCQRENFSVILTDDASYMKKAVKILKTMYPNLFGVKCLAHLIHNCCMKIKSEYQKVDRLISAMKNLTLRNNTNRQIFTIIGGIPQVICTRWSSWLRAALFYSEKLVEIRKLFETVEGDLLLVTRARESVFNDGLIDELTTIAMNYEVLIDLNDELERSKLNLKSAFDKIINISLKSDPINLKEYINNRLVENDIKAIVNYKNKNVSPFEYAQLFMLIPTTVIVERSFSSLQKMLRSDRGFCDDNLFSYFSVIFNSRKSSYMIEEDSNDHV
ncbi:hypothetical protein DMUE_5706 [Dictyocoela muelleri]|nr:hypothetical protein DMUE_5706 [Dictyocoela muelleri]